MAISLSSLISSNQYNIESLSVPFVAAMKVGTGYSAPVFNGANNATSVDPGGLFGWLVYSRSNPAFFDANTQPKGLTTAEYIAYTDPAELVSDLNRLSGVTFALVGISSGSTYSLFETDYNTYQAKTVGIQFFHALSNLAYGGTLVLAGQVAGFNKYLQDNPNAYFDVVIDPVIDPSIMNWLKTQQYTTGIFASRPDSQGITGRGFTMADYISTIGISESGITQQGLKFFTVYGTKVETDLDISTIQAGKKISYQISAVSDVGGFFARAKNNNELYLTVAGQDRSYLANGDIENPIDWFGSAKNILRGNKVNFFVNAEPKFLGSDLVGSTATTGAITVNDRIGPARLRLAIIQAVNTVGMKYVFQINNQTTRDQVVSEVQTALDAFGQYLDTTKTQIICNGSNNDNNSETLKIQVIAKPLLGTDAFVVDFSYTQ